MIGCRLCNPSDIACPRHVPMWIYRMLPAAHKKKIAKWRKTKQAIK